MYIRAVLDWGAFPVFRPPRDRDAHASIRGYVFQIDRTVLRWLNLGEDESLELEQGEDIDLVRQMLPADGTVGSESRLLEQIKHRETTITLRTPAAQEALANFHDHRANNAGSQLSFCFLTNAVAGREQLSPFPDIAGIALWEQVRTHQLDAGELNSAVDLLQKFLLNTAKPNGFPLSVWSAWRTYLRSTSAQEFQTYIERFEWSTGQLDGDQLPARIVEQAIASGFAKDQAESHAICNCLFMHITRLLAKPGIKRLTVLERSRLLAQPMLPDAERETLLQLRAIVTGHSDRLDQVEAEVSAIGSQVDMLVLGQSSGGRIELAVPMPDLSTPQPVSRLCSRSHLVGELGQLLSKHTWISIRGGPDIGKSQLAIQVAAGNDRCRGWIRFRDCETISAAAERLDSALVALAGWSQPPGHSNWYSEAFGVIGTESLLVLDDLPRMAGNDGFTEQLTQFGSAASAAGVRILSTSQFDLPSRFHNQLGDLRFHDWPAPPFTNEEAANIFRSYGAASSFLVDRRVGFLNSLAGGHPVLLTATAEFLAGRAWQYQDAEIEALLRGDHAHRVMPEVIGRLTRTLGDFARELLYRLTLPIGSFEQAQVKALADVEPRVDRPLEQFTELLGAWIQRDNDIRFAVSPLVKPLGQTELANDVCCRCYRELGEGITRNRVLGPYEVNRAIEYNLLAREFDRAVTLYVLLLVAAMKKKRTEHVVALLDRWRQTALPAELSVGSKLMVRAYQVAAFPKFNLDTRFILCDIDRLLGAATEKDGWGMVALAIQTLGSFRSRQPARVLTYIRRAVALRKVHGPSGKEIVLDTIRIPDLLWMMVTELNTPSLLNQWLDTVESLPEAYRATFWRTKLAREGVWLVPHGLYRTEWVKSKSQQDWDGVLHSLRDALTRAQGLNQPRLEAAITALILDIQGDRKHLDGLADIANPTLARWPNEPAVQAKVRGSWGRIYAEQHQPELALPLLDAALSVATGQDDHERLRCLLAANLCVPAQDLRYIEQARELARSSTTAPGVAAARALGEYALASFDSQGGQEGAIAVFPAWSEAMRQFFSIASKDDIWRDQFALYGHVTGYLSQLATYGTAPDRTIEGEKWIVPGRRFLMKEYLPEREAFYKPGAEASLFWVMAEYASRARADEDSAYWMQRASEEARQSKALFIQVICKKDAIADLLTRGRFEDAIEAGVFAGRGMVLPRTSGPENFGGLGVDHTAEFKKLSPEKRRQGDAFSVVAVMIPTAFWIVRMSLRDPAGAISAGLRVAAICRQLSEDDWGDQDLWRTTAEFFEMMSVEQANSGQILEQTKKMKRQDERGLALRVLGTILATWHASTEEAIHCQLACIEVLLKWFAPRETVHRLILLPYVQSFWQRAAQECRFTFRTPDLTVAAIQAACALPEANQVAAILIAASEGFAMRGLGDVVRNLRKKVVEGPKPLSVTS